MCVCVHMCVYVFGKWQCTHSACVSVYIHKYIYIYIYIYMCVCVCVCVWQEVLSDFVSFLFIEKLFLFLNKSNPFKISSLPFAR